MIGISTQIYDLEGARIFEDLDPGKEQKNRRGERRVTRTATLDGGVSIADMGYSDGDRTITVMELAASLEAVEFVEYICRNYTLVTVTAEDGAYSAAPETHAVGEDGTLTFTLLVKEKMSA